MPRPRCILCNGTGQVIEDRILYKKLRVDAPPQLCWKRVDSEADGLEQMRALVAADDSIFEPQLTTGAKACPNCHPVAASRGLASVASQDLSHLSKEVGRDWKMAQAGER